MLAGVSKEQTERKHRCKQRWPHSHPPTSEALRAYISQLTATQCTKCTQQEQIYPTFRHLQVQLTRQQAEGTAGAAAMPFGNDCDASLTTATYKAARCACLWTSKQASMQPVKQPKYSPFSRALFYFAKPSASCNYMSPQVGARDCLAFCSPGACGALLHDSRRRKRD